MQRKGCTVLSLVCVCVSTRDTVDIQAYTLSLSNIQSANVLNWVYFFYWYTVLISVSQGHFLTGAQ